MRAKLLQFCLTLCDPMNCSPPGSSLSMGFSRQEYWSGLPCPLLGDLLNPGIEPRPSTCRQILYHLSHQGSPNYSLLSWKPGLILLWLLLISIQTHWLLSYVPLTLIISLFSSFLSRLVETHTLGFTPPRLSQSFASCILVANPPST